MPPSACAVKDQTFEEVIPVGNDPSVFLVKNLPVVSVNILVGKVLTAPQVNDPSPSVISTCPAVPFPDTLSLEEFTASSAILAVVTESSANLTVIIEPSANLAMGNSPAVKSLALVTKPAIFCQAVPL